MKKLLVAVMMMMMWAGVAWGIERECKDCSKDVPCTYFTQLDDGCNYCTCRAYCVGGKWYSVRDTCTCTTMGCTEADEEISNPFEENDK